MAKTTDRLLAGLKRRVIIPSSQPLMSDSDMLALADDVIASTMVPMLKSTRQDFFVTSTRTDLVAATSSYSIPYRAAGRTVRDLKRVDSAGSKLDLNLIASEDEHLFAQTGDPHSFYFKGDKIILVPTPDSADYDLEIWYELMPSSLVETTSASLVSTATTTVVTVDQVPSGITNGVTVDFIQGRSGNTILSMDVTVQGATSTTITFASGEVPTSLGSGDYVALSQQTPVIMLPDECYPLLETLTSMRILEAIGDFEGADRLKDQAKDERKDLLKMLEPRITGESTKIINRNGLLRGARTAYRRGFFR
jgi:hypothetical protein